MYTSPLKCSVAIRLWPDDSRQSMADERSPSCCSLVIRWMLFRRTTVQLIVELIAILTRPYSTISTRQCLRWSWRHVAPLIHQPTHDAWRPVWPNINSVRGATTALCPYLLRAAANMPPTSMTVHWPLWRHGTGRGSEKWSVVVSGSDWTRSTSADETEGR